MQALKQRAAILQTIRDFFAAKQVLEVETPILSHAMNSDPYIDSIQATVNQQTMYLNTSPEFPMKRLLAAGSGCIYQINKCFRDNESGRLHNPEFTMLEWYRVGLTYQQLMDEVQELLQIVLGETPCQRFTYQQLFQRYCDVDPFQSSPDQLAKVVKQYAIDIDLKDLSKDDVLNLLLSHVIEPQLAKDTIVFVYDYPASQAALASIKQDDALIAERFEVYYQGIELANGYQELQGAKPYQQRFEKELQQRKHQQKTIGAIDQQLLNALQQGLPACAGVALGLDRLVMLACNANDISQVISFTIDVA